MSNFITKDNLLSETEFCFVFDFLRQTQFADTLNSSNPDLVNCTIMFYNWDWDNSKLLNINETLGLVGYLYALTEAGVALNINDTFSNNSMQYAKGLQIGCLQICETKEPINETQIQLNLCH